MDSIRTTSAAAAAIALLVLLALAAPLAGGCGHTGGAAPTVLPSDAHLAAASPPPRPSATPVHPTGSDYLGAARTVVLYCRLLDRGQLARAATLCSRGDLWSRHELTSLRAFRFRSARVYAAPDARTVTLLTRVRVRVGRDCPLPDGLATLFFTLGRVGTAAGDWLITAVATSP